MFEPLGFSNTPRYFVSVNIADLLFQRGETPLRKGDLVPNKRERPSDAACQTIPVVVFSYTGHVAECPLKENCGRPYRTFVVQIVVAEGDRIEERRALFLGLRSQFLTLSLERFLDSHEFALQNFQFQLWCRFHSVF